MILVIIGTALPGFADNTKSRDVLSYYDAELFKVGYSMFGGLQLNYQGQSSGIAFGIPDTFKAALVKYPDTRALVESYGTLDLTGNILVWGGLGAVLVGCVLPALDTNYINNGVYSGTETAAIGLVLGGLVAELIGAFVLPAGYERLTNAVNTYNRHEMENYTEPSP